MKKFSLFFLLMLFIAFFLLSGCSKTADVSQTGQTGEEEKISFVPGEILVDFRDNVTENEIQNFRKKYNLGELTLNSKYSEDEKLMRVKVDDSEIGSLVETLSHDSLVEYAEPDYIYYAYSALPDDPLYKYQWHMDQIKVRDAWDINTGEGVIVAVIDTGVAYLNYEKFHRAEDLEHTLFTEGYDFINDRAQACDDNSHGTHVAGTIAQTTYNGKGVVGISYNCKIMPLKVLSAQGFGSLADIADAVKYAADHHAKVINMSLGGPYNSKILASACTYAYQKGVTIVCAAGNSSSTRIGYPAAHPECIAVSAVRYDKEITFYSNKGKNIDIAAPGGDLNVDQNGDGKKDGVLQNTIGRMNPSTDDYYLFQGTSMASPHVAGVAAMIASLGVTNPAAVEQILKDSANKNVPKDLDTGYGAGIVDARSAVMHAGLLRGFVKLLLGLFLLAGLFYVFQNKYNIKTAPSSPLFFIGNIIGSSGLFFLPFFGITVLYSQIICAGFPQWEIAFFGAGYHMTPLFYSALFPLILSLLLGRIPLINKLIIGFNIGVAGHLLYGALSNDATMIWIPPVVDKIWLLLNCGVCLVLAWFIIILSNSRKIKES
jgi:serine protease